MDKKKLVVCTVCENEAPYLPEWLAYHHLVGVEHFVLYDNGSTDDPAQAIRSSPLAEHVTLIRWPQRPGQAAAYRHFIDIFSPGYDWVAFIDVDEFLLPLGSRKVADTLDGLRNASAVLVHRRLFGPGTWREPPWGLVIERNDRRADDDFPANRRVKPIVRCSALRDVTDNPLEFRINGLAFNTAGRLAPNTAIQAQPCYQNLVINHYYARSRPVRRAPSEPNTAATNATTPKNDAGLLDHLAAACQVQDTTIQSFAASVRALLGVAVAAAPPEEANRPRPADSGSMGMAVPSAPAVAPEPTAMPVAVVASGEVPEPATAAPVQPVPQARGQRYEPETRRGAAVSSLLETTPAWVQRGHDAQERSSGLGMVYRDRSRAGEHWLAALRGAAVAAIDPAFLLDEFDRIRDFPTDAEARAACDAALEQSPST